MTHRIVSVNTLNNMTLSVVFQNGIVKKLDVQTLYSIFPQFKAFETTPDLFQQVQVDTGGYGVSWNDTLDLDTNTLWENGVETDNKQDVGVLHLVAANLINARDHAGLTQKQLADRTGIHQSDICKIERGLANPSISTLQRLAHGLGMSLQIQFVTTNK